MLTNLVPIPARVRDTGVAGGAPCGMLWVFEDVPGVRRCLGYEEDVSKMIPPEVMNK